MVALEFNEPLEITTAYSDGYIWHMMDCGPHAGTLDTVIIKATGECWQMTHKDFSGKTNTTPGICKQYESPLNEKPASTSLNGVKLVK